MEIEDKQNNKNATTMTATTMTATTTKYPKTFVQKYKPKKLSDILTNKNIFNATQKLNKLDQCLLFIGNGNCGKTTLLQVIMKEYFEGYKKDDYEMNVMIIDNLKEQGINYFRKELLQFFKCHCTLQNKKKILFIDDLDNLSTPCQIILESHIDEFKDKSKFICFASCLNKITVGLQSRLCLIELKEPNNNYLSNFIDMVCNNENISIEEDAKKYIANVCENNIAFVLNALEKIHLYGIDCCEPLKLEKCKELICIISDNIFDNYFCYLMQNKWKEALLIIKNISKNGYSVIDILDTLYLYLKKTKQMDDITKCEIIKELCISIKNFHCLHENSIELYFFTYKISSICCKK
jgi:DNA polymerase III delta prime subunit